jgi:NADH:ubiquinone oxidoreductase subunit E
MKKLDADIIEFIDECMESDHPESYLIAVMHKVQGRYGYLSEDHMNQMAQRMQIPVSTISGVSTFYHFFRLKPKGKYNISVCLGTACFVNGADKVLDAVRTEIGIEVGETSKDEMFSLECSRCIGVCALAPVVTINDRVFSRVTPNRVPKAVEKMKSEEEE